jgi:hypothetical protein
MREYFEDFIDRIDTPQLEQLSVTFFIDPIFDIPRLRDFIGRTEKLKLFNQASMEFTKREIKIALGSPINYVRVGNQM